MRNNEVTIVNDNLNPIPVEGTVKIAEPVEPFQAEGSCTTNGSWSTSEDLFTVPAGKMAIVEYASADANLPANNALGAMVRTTLNSVEIAHNLSSSVVSPTNRSIMIGQQVRLYAGPGTAIRMSGGTAGDAIPGGMTVYFKISGRLVDFP